MCGIMGIVSEHLPRSQTEPLIDQMLEKLHHRGPDGQGKTFFPHCSLGHTRLSIVDLHSGDQPMVSPHKTGIVFNGEIYGYQELKSQHSDYPYQTDSDTEVILALYESQGQDLLHTLPGMFAFALWDETKQELFCARDRFGEKPFYYAFTSEGDLVFASELKAIVSHPNIRPVLSRKSLEHYLTYLYVHPHQTIYENIFTLPPAHAFTYRPGETQIIPYRYWDIPKSQNSLSLEEASQHLKHLLRKSIRHQLVADVEVGAFLSGGLDSSSIVALASQEQAKLKTFSFGFEGTSHELPYAKQVAELYHTDHIELMDRDSNIEDLLLKMAYVYDEPFADSSNIPTYVISQMASQYIKVVLTGDGGDELFGGYTSRYQTLLWANECSSQPKAFQWILRAIIKLLSQFGVSTQGLRHYLIALGHHTHSSHALEAHDRQMRYFSRGELESLGISSDRPSPTPYDSSIPVQAALNHDLGHYMPGDILVKTDRASMAHSLELRAPFLDRELAEFVISLPSQLKVTKTEDKILLREACAQEWPDAIRKREKMGFGAPVERWLRQPRVQELKRDYLENSNRRIHSLLSSQALKTYAHQNQYPTWILLVLSIWLENQPGVISSEL